MIPPSYLFKDLYNDRWGDPLNPHPVDLPAPKPRRLYNPLARLATLFKRHPGHPTAWSFTIPSRSR